MITEKIESGLTQKIKHLRAIRDLELKGESGLQLWELVGHLIVELEMLSDQLTWITQSVERLSRRDSTVSWNALGEFQNAPKADIHVGRTMLLVRQIERIVSSSTIPAAQLSEVIRHLDKVIFIRTVRPS